MGAEPWPAAISQRIPPKSLTCRHPAPPGRAQAHSHTDVVNSISRSCLTERCLRQVAAEEKALITPPCPYTRLKCGIQPPASGQPWQVLGCPGGITPRHFCSRTGGWSPQVESRLEPPRRF